MKKAKKPGPLPETAVTASMYFSGNVITSPIDMKISLTTIISLSEKQSHNDMTVIPFWMSAGVLGMTRMIFFVLNLDVKYERVMPAAIETTVLSSVTVSFISLVTASMFWGLTASITKLHLEATSKLLSVVIMLYCFSRYCLLSSRGSETRISFMP